MNASQIERLLIEYGHISERKRELDTKIQEAEFLKKNTENTLKTPKNNGTPHYNTLYDSVFQAVQKILDEYQIHLDYYYGQLEMLNQEETIMYESLKCLTPTEYKIIELRYFKQYRWNNIVSKSNYCERQCINLRNSAINKLIFNYPRYKRLQ